MVYISLVSMVVYKRKKMKRELTNGGLPGAKAGCPMRGLLLGCDMETVVLILDIHVTHTKKLAAAEMAQEAGVVMVSFPRNTTH